MTRRFLPGLAMLALLAVPASTMAQNLADNGDFDDNIDGWEVYSSPNLVAEWSGTDRLGDSNSGSLLATNSALAGGNYAIVHCVESISDQVPYQFSGFAYVPTEQASTGKAQLFFYWYADTGCTGGQMASVNGTPDVVAGDGWTYVSTAAAVPPGGAMSAWLILGVYKQSSEPGTFQAYFDGLDFRATLFHDGFESGGTSLWSSTASP